MKTIHLLIGIPGSGKSVFAKQLSKEKQSQIVSIGGIRRANIEIKEEDVWSKVYWELKECLISDQVVVFDACSITNKIRQELIDNLEENYLLIHHVDYQIISYYFPTFHEICSKRVAIRNNMSTELFVPIETISLYGEKIIPPLYEEKFHECRVVTNAPNLTTGLIKDSFQGYTLYIKHRDNIIEEYSGFACIEEKTVVRSDTCFRLASVSKQFIAYAIMQLIDTKRLTLQTTLDDIFHYLPDYTKNITIRHLLNHTSGLLDYEDMDYCDDQIRDCDVLEFVQTAEKTYFSAGQQYRYSNTGYVLLGLVIEQITKMNISDYLSTYVFEALEMDNSCVNHQGITQIKNRAYGHIRKDGCLIKSDQSRTSATIGDGGIYSNIGDLKKWLKKMRSLHHYPYNLMKETTHLKSLNGTDEYDIEYVFGLRIKKIANNQIIYHCGSTIGTNTIMGYVEELDLEFIFLTNEDGLDTSLFINNLREMLSNKHE